MKQELGKIEINYTNEMDSLRLRIGLIEALLDGALGDITTLGSEVAELRQAQLRPKEEEDNG